MAAAAPAPAVVCNQEACQRCLHILQQLCAPQPGWGAKQQQLGPLADLLQQQPREASEALLLAGPAAVLDNLMAVIVTQQVLPGSKLQAADVLAAVCCDAQASLLLSPGLVVERLMRIAFKGDTDSRSAAARALWQLSCHNDFSPEVVSHAGNAFRVVELLAEDMQQGGSSSTCMCALRATQNLLHTYASSGAGAGDAGDRIGGRVIQPLCNILGREHPETAAAAAELLALLAQTAQNRARIVAAGGIPRLINLMRHASSTSPSSTNSNAAADADSAADSSPDCSPTAGRSTRQHRQAAADAAAEAAMLALAQMARGDAKLSNELLAAHVVPGLLQLLQGRGGRCAAAALSLLGDLAGLPEGRRALRNADGFTVLAGVAEACPEQQLCRLLSKATKGTSGSATCTAPEVSGLLSSPDLLAVLVRCCRPADRKTRKRAMQVLLRLLEAGRSDALEPLPLACQLPAQLVSMGLLAHIPAVLAAQQPAGPAGSSASLLEVQLAVSLLHELVACSSIFSASRPSPDAPAPGTCAKASGGGDETAADDLQQQPDQDSGHHQQQHHLLQHTAARQDAAAAAMQAAPHLVWQHPAAAAAAFGDLQQLLRRGQAASIASQHAASSGFANPEAAELWGSLLWLLQQQLLAPGPASLQQQVLQVVSELAAHRHAGLLQLMVQQGWVQVLWSFLPGGRQLLALVMSQLLQEQQRQEQQGAPAELPAAGSDQPGSGMQHAAHSSSSVASGAAGRPACKASNLQQHLLQLLDESLPSLEQTLHALQALAHLTSQPAAAAVAVQLQVSYSAAAAAGLISWRPASHGTAESAAVAMLFGSVGRLDSMPPSAVHHMLHVRACSSQPHSPRHLPATPRSIASTSSSSGASTGPAGGSASITRTSSAGLLSRLGLRSGSTGGTSNQQHQPKQAAAAGDAAVRAGNRSAPGKQPVTADTPLPAPEPVEDPGSALQMLATLLGEQWAATAAAELLAHMFAANPGACAPALLEQGVPATLCSCMGEVQENGPGAVAALATLKLAAQLARHCPVDALTAAGLVPAVLRMLVFGQQAAACADVASSTSRAVQCSALQVLAVLCADGDRRACAAVARAALLLLTRWLCGDAPAQSADAAAVLAALLDAGVVDAAAVDAVLNQQQADELLRLCLECLPAAQQGHAQQQDAAGTAAVVKQQEAQQQAPQQLVRLTAVRLLCQCVQLDSRFASALLAAEGLPVLVGMLSAAAAAAGAAPAAPPGAASPAGSAAAIAAGSGLLMQYELLKLLDGLSLVHRLELVKANIVPVIVAVLRQQPSPAQAPQQQQQQEAQATAAADGPSVQRSASGSAQQPPGVARSLSRLSSSKAGTGQGADELLLRSQELCCNLITVLAISNDVKRQLFHADAVGPLMRMAEAQAEGARGGWQATEAIRAALAQLGLVYLLPQAAAPAGGGGAGV